MVIWPGAHDVTLALTPSAAGMVVTGTGVSVELESSVTKPSSEIRELTSALMAASWGAFSAAVTRRAYSGGALDSNIVALVPALVGTFLSAMWYPGIESPIRA